MAGRTAAPLASCPDTAGGRGHRAGGCARRPRGHGGARRVRSSPRLACLPSDVPTQRTPAGAGPHHRGQVAAGLGSHPPTRSVQVSLDGAHRRAQADCDFPVGQAGRHHFGDLALTAGQRKRTDRDCAVPACTGRRIRRPTVAPTPRRSDRVAPAAAAERDGRLGRGIGGRGPVTDLTVAAEAASRPSPSPEEATPRGGQRYWPEEATTRRPAHVRAPPPRYHPTGSPPAGRPIRGWAAPGPAHPPRRLPTATASASEPAAARASPWPATRPVCMYR